MDAIICPKKITKLSEYVMKQQNKLLGHVIRSDFMDPMRCPTIDKNLDTPGVFLRRSGKPRMHSVKENCKWVYTHVLEKIWPEKPTREQELICITEIVNAAMADKF